MTESNPRPGERSQQAFVTTRWTHVLRARGDSSAARAALSELCEAYWMPVFCFLRSDARDSDATRELTQEFFAQLLARQGLDTVQPGRGRFRSFLLGAVKHFLADRRDRARAAKRGGGQAVVPWPEVSDTTSRPSEPESTAPVPDTYFDREWARTLVNRAVSALASEQTTENQQQQFAVLKPWLLGDASGTHQAEAARQLGLSENALRVAVHRLRRHFRHLVKAEIAQTLEDPAQSQEELHYLLDVLSQQGANASVEE